MYYQIFSHTLKNIVRPVAGALAVLLFLAAMFGYTSTLFAQTTEEETPATETTDTTPAVETAATETTDTTPEETVVEEPATTENTATEGADGASTPSTDPGTDGTGEVTTDTETGDAEVTTGDAAASGDTETTANTNETTTDTPDGTDTTVLNTNDATADNAAAVDAATGDNSAQASGGSATITTGDATAQSNTINVINTNIFDSNGLFYFLNVLMGNVAFDLRNLFSIFTGGAPAPEGCTIESCDHGDTTLTITNDNTADVNNDVAVSAGTGSNTATAGAGDATVTTGDAYASANVVNLVNTNIVDSNYLLLSINNFGDFANDIIFPGADWFKDLLKGSVSAGSDTSVTNTNTASVGNTVGVDADTGGNTASGTSAVVSTGDAHAAATVVNQVNTNIFGDSLMFLFRIHGDWAGNVFGLPEGITWRDTGDGVELFLDPSGSINTLVGSTDHLSVTNNNTATVTNNVSVVALTGDNEAAAGTGDATVTTGDAYASANVVNVVNTNILGRNWVLAIFNIFGDWTGNISFGQPDLWVGARALLPQVVRGGQCFTYEVTVNNLGDAVATDVVLDGFFDRGQQYLDGFDEQYDDHLRLNVGTMRAGASKLVTLHACVHDSVPGNTAVNTAFVLDSTEPDADTSNNSDVIAFVTAPSGGGGALRLGPAKLSVEKMASTKAITASSSVDYKVVIKNTGDPVYNALLVDTISDENGKPIYEQRWGLDVIHANETIIVDYTAFFNASTTPGVYTNKAFVSGTDRSPDFEHNLASPVESPIASVDVLVTSKEVFEWEYDETTCSPLLTTYIRYNEPNDADEVNKLQYFLKTNEGDGSVALTGTYDDATYRAVHAFQRRYAADILDPWGIAQTTGYVYYTTQKKINELYCRDSTFPLSREQWAEIDAFKNRVRAAAQQGTQLPAAELNEVGLAPSASDTGLAMAAPDDQQEDASVAQSDQVAAAAEALTSDATVSIWQRLRDKMNGILGWTSF